MIYYYCMADNKSSGPGDGTYIIVFLIILFVLWVISGGPQRSPESRYNQFMEPIGVGGGTGQTYHDDPLGKPGSVTRTIPFLK